MASKKKPSKVEFTVYLRDVMRDAINIIKRKFPNYEIKTIREDGKRSIRSWFGCSGDPGNCDVSWFFDLVKKRKSLSGPTRVKAELNPIWNIVMEEFPKVEEMLVWEVTSKQEKSPRRISVGKLRCTAVDAEITFYDKH